MQLHHDECFSKVYPIRYDLSRLSLLFKTRYECSFSLVPFSHFEFVLGNKLLPGEVPTEALQGQSFLAHFLL